MENFLLYIGKSALAAGAFYLVYLALFQNQKQFAFNRIYLPVSLAVSFLIPLITFTTVNYVEPVPVESNPLPVFTESVKPMVMQQYESKFIWEWYHYLFAIYAAGTLLFLFRLMLGHGKAWNIIRKSRVQQLFNSLVNISKKDIHPFSFFSKIVLSENTLSHPHLEMIVEHEKIHVKEKHTLDILFTEILFLLQWFNPFAWLLKDAVKNNLEYKTDHEIAKITDPQTYQLAMLALADKQGVAPFLTALNGSQLKSRIIMMKKKNENKYAFLKKLVVLPLLAILVMGLSNKEVKTEVIQPKNQTEISNSENIIKGKVIDKNGNPISGTSVIVKGKIVGTITDSEGKYELKLDNENETLVFWMVGFEKIQIPVKEQNRIDVQFKSEKTVHLNTTSTKTFATEKEYKYTVKGKVINEKGEPVPGASVIIKGNTIGTITNNIGEYEIRLEDKNESLVFSKPGYLYRTVRVLGREKINVLLYDDKKGANEAVIVNGYATKQEADISNRLAKDSVVQINSDTKERPIYVVDGVETDNIEAINQYNIEKIDFLKNIAATELYGEKGKNGVVLITTKQENTQKEKPALIVEEMPEFPGGEPALKKFIEENTNYPPIARENRIKGKVYVKFIVDKTGKVTNPAIARGVVPVLDKEALRVVGMFPDWKPGNQKGKQVDVPYTVPITFGNPDKVQISEKPDPLFIVDGKVVGNIDSINPDDIESVSVLKDKSATELYGEKGENGVIVVMTKGSEAIQKGELPVVLNGKLTQLTLNEVDRDLIQNIERIEPEEAIKKYGKKGENGVFEITSRNVYTDKVNVKSSEELKEEKITSELELRKFIAKEIIFPKEARDEVNSALHMSFYVHVNKKGEIEKIEENQRGSKTAIYIDEIVIVAERDKSKIPEADIKNGNLMAEEAVKAINKISVIEVDEFKGQVLKLNFKFVLQD